MLKNLGYWLPAITVIPDLNKFLEMENAGALFTETGANLLWE